MIVYCDTSALLKLYVDEAHTPSVEALLTRSEAVSVCRIAWAEAQAALARRLREQPDAATAIATARSALARDWPAYVVIEVSQAVVELAGDYADSFALRGYDAVQLAACASFAREVCLPVHFACFDQRLNKAARVLGLEVPFIDLS
ncbi:type II toxin-antitoxin system VapC family toxin [Sinimarinibacterium thermocellulolyticum]|uniref:Type II toxin-antitoxin system VapC family toxin n=1 Tax=Sinimarinibacterium thermocellulolyticum TaxID=3170016 RepID=A0ABV2ABX7_9GAMM